MSLADNDIAECRAGGTGRPPLRRLYFSETSSIRKLVGRRAITPATCGVAIGVPLIVFAAVLLVFQAGVMLEPGAKMSRHVP
jgi:hypothetical protein